TDTAGAVRLQASIIDVRGSIEALAGKIDLTAEGVQLRSGSSLVARGTPVIYVGTNGLRTGEVLAGGAISIAGKLDLDAGSLIDVSGASGSIDVIAGSKTPRSLAIASDGGSISLRLEGLGSYVDSDLNAHAGGDGAAGGSLTLVEAGAGAGGPLVQPSIGV